MPASNNTLHYFEVPSSLGKLFVTWTKRGVASLLFAPSAEQKRRELKRLQKSLHLSEAAVARKHARLDRELRNYLKTGKPAFGTPVDLRACPEFTKSVLMRLNRLGTGKTTTYGDLARAAGRPKAARAAGQAVGANPLPIIIPCHRVLAADGSLGGYSGGLPRKKKLLALERLPVPPGGWPPQKRRKN